MRRAILIVVLGAAGCEAADRTASGEDEDRAWVMVEARAAAAGFLVKHDDWADAPALPTEIDPEAPTWLHDPDGSETALEIPAGMVGRVKDGGEVDLVEPGVDVPGDRLYVRGTPGGVEALADLLGAHAERAGAGFVLVAEAILERTSFLELPDGIEAIALAEDELAVAGGSGAGYAMVTGQEEGLASLVGVYSDASSTIAVDAEGGFSWRSCSTVPRSGQIVLDAQGVTLVGDDGVVTSFTLVAKRLVNGEHSFFLMGDP